MKITVFQALTLLAEKYSKRVDERATYEKIVHLYLSGINCDEDRRLLVELFQDPLLMGHTISDDREDINRDPVRRYFESQLCCATLAISVDPLNLELLELNLKTIMAQIPPEDKWRLLAPIFNHTLNNGRYLKGCEKEFFEAIRLLNQNNSYPFLKPQINNEAAAISIWLERKKKISLLMKAVCASLVAAAFNNERMPLVKLYRGDASIFSETHRGRKVKVDPDTQEPQQVRPQTLGIMRSYMPVPTNDTLLADHCADFLRPVDGSTYINDRLIPEKLFATKVTPFVASISGTLLGTIRVQAFLLKKDKFVYYSNSGQCKYQEDQLKNYFRSLISFLLYFSGGHSLKEFMSVLELEEVQDKFRMIPKFAEMNLESLFKVDNTVAFVTAVQQTINYNQMIIRRKKVQLELTTTHSMFYFRPSSQFYDAFNKYRIQLSTIINNTHAEIKKYQCNFLSLSHYVKDLFFCSNLSRSRFIMTDKLIQNLIKLDESILISAKGCSFYALEELCLHYKELCTQIQKTNRDVLKNNKRQNTFDTLAIILTQSLVEINSFLVHLGSFEKAQVVLEKCKMNDGSLDRHNAPRRAVL